MTITLQLISEILIITKIIKARKNSCVKIDNIDINNNNSTAKRKAKMVKEYYKSLSNTSTTSVESGIFDVDIITSDDEDIEVHIGQKVKEILCEAQKESRLICGWKDTIKYLNETENPEHSLFLILIPSSSTDDKLSHMQEVMTRAYCLENDIYVIQIDNMEKFNSILGNTKQNHSCALIQRSSTMKMQNPDDEIDLDEFTPLENDLIDYCEDNWLEPVKSIIRLPEK